MRQGFCQDKLRKGKSDKGERAHIAVIRRPGVSVGSPGSAPFCDRNSNDRNYDIQIPRTKQYYSDRGERAAGMWDSGTRFSRGFGIR